MPQRFLKPGIVTSLRLARCSPWAQLLYYKLISLVDDVSRYDAHPTVISRAAFPYGDTKGRTIKDDQIETWLAELENARIEAMDDPCLTRYRVNGTRYLFLNRWTERCRSRFSRYPSPSLDIECWHMLSYVVKSQQMLVPTAPSTYSNTSTTIREREGGNSLADVMASRTTAGVIAGEINKLEARKDDLDGEEREQLRQKKRALAEIQKKQAAGNYETT